MRRPRPAGRFRRLSAYAAAAVVAAAVAPGTAQGTTASGTVRVCAQAFGGLPPSVVKGFTRQHPRLRLVDVPFPDVQNGTQLHDELVRLQRQRSRKCDLYVLDVIWTAEFGAKRWARDVSSIVKPMRGDFIPSALTTAEYRGRYYGVPMSSDAGLLYYRTDRVSAVPDTWQGLYDSARATGGLVYQASAYEGLTCDFLEIAFAAGGGVLSSDGRSSVIDSPENLAALRFMVEGVKTGVVPTIVPFYFDEEDAFTAFFSGGPTYMRNWPYAYGLGQGTNFKDDFDVAPLPAWSGGRRAGVLGGGVLAISRWTRNPRRAVVALKYLTSAASSKVYATKWQTAPARTALYDDSGVQKAFPFAAQLKDAIKTAQSRPAHPRYSELSAAIYENVNAALLDEVTPEVALRRADRRISRLLR